MSWAHMALCDRELVDAEFRVTKQVTADLLRVGVSVLEQRMMCRAAHDVSSSA